MRARSTLAIVLSVVVFPIVACGDDDALPARAEEAILAGAPTSRPEVALLADVADTQTCTGTLLAPDVILTAAHCVVKSEWAYFGYSKRTRDRQERISANAPPGVERRRVVERARMPGFAEIGCPMRGAADVGLLRLDRPVPGIAPTTLGDLPSPGAECLVVGYGRHNADGSVRSVEAAESEFRYNEQRGARVRVDTTSVIAGQRPGLDWFSARGVDGAHSKGDSGGPLFCEGTLRGIASCSTNRNGPVLDLVKVYASAEGARSFIDDTLARWSRGPADR